MPTPSILRALVLWWRPSRLLLGLVVAATPGFAACSLVVASAGLTGGTRPEKDSGTSPAGGGSEDSGISLPNPGASSDAGDAISTATDAAADAPADTDTGAPDAGADTAPPSACSLGEARVFLTATVFGADLGGIDGADRACQESAVPLGGTWKAWLSNATTAAASHIYIAPRGYVLVDGATVVAPSYAALISGTLSHAINLTQFGAPTGDAFTEVWTGTDVTSSMLSQGYCANDAGTDWSSSNPTDPSPLVGHSDATDATWSAAYLQLCDRTNVRLYCFESCP